MYVCNNLNLFCGAGQIHAFLFSRTLQSFLHQKLTNVCVNKLNLFCGAGQIHAFLFSRTLQSFLHQKLINVCVNNLNLILWCCDILF